MTSHRDVNQVDNSALGAKDKLRGSLYPICDLSLTTYASGRGCQTFPCFNLLHFGSWNVEGLTDIKLYQLCSIMRLRALGVLCLQETRVPVSGSRTLDDGFILITAGNDDDQKTNAGVGFLVAPSIRSSILNFCQHTNRIASLKLRVTGGKMSILAT